MHESETHYREWIERAIDGDDSAYRLIVESFMKRIYAFARIYTDSHEDAEDIVQNTFFKAWKNLKRFDQDKPFAPWLFAIARNTALDHLKKRSPVPFSALDGEDEPYADTIADDTSNHYELFESFENRRTLAEVMSNLSPDHQAVVMLHYEHEMTFEEIAQTMNTPMNTVKSWHRRALAKIKDLLLHQNTALGRSTEYDQK